MKKEHIDLVWESLNDFEKSNITFSLFLEKLGKALESADVAEAKMIGEATRNIEFALVSGSTQEVRKLMNELKTNLERECRLPAK
ncbi:MAG: hypothetical protein Kow0029_11310 [Candidatus Rifleibacteriota bacterium]